MGWIFFAPLRLSLRLCVKFRLVLFFLHLPYISPPKLQQFSTL